METTHNGVRAGRGPRCRLEGCGARASSEFPRENRVPESAVSCTREGHAVFAQAAALVCGNVTEGRRSGDLSGAPSGYSKTPNNRLIQNDNFDFFKSIRMRGVAWFRGPKLPVPFLQHPTENGLRSL
jgi:hypothetical protein